MPSEPPPETAPDGKPTVSEPGESGTTVDGAATSGGEDDRSYEQQVQHELVPSVTVNGINSDRPTDEDDPEIDADTDAEGDLSGALERIDDDLLTTFIKIVVSIKAGILLLSVGLLVIGFREMLTVGGGLIVVGCLAFARAVSRYWRHKRASQQTDAG